MRSEEQLNLFGYREVHLEPNCEKIDVLYIGKKFVNWLCQAEIPNLEFSESNLYKSYQQETFTKKYVVRQYPII